MFWYCLCVELYILKLEVMQDLFIVQWGFEGERC